MCPIGKRGAKDTDLLMYISSDKDSCLPGMIAIATACDVDPITKRPILGSLNICGDALKGLSTLKAGSDAEQTAIGRVVEVLVHETVHVLVSGVPDCCVNLLMAVLIISHQQAYLGQLVVV